MKDSTLHTKLESIVRAGKPKSMKVDGKSVYISKKKIEEGRKALEKDGGILPLIPLILGGLSATGALAGGAAGIAKSVNDKQHQDAMLAEEKRANRVREGMGIKQDVIKFLQGIGFQGDDLKCAKKFFKNLSGITPITPTKKGALILGKGLNLKPWK